MPENRDREVDREISATTRWGVSTLIVVLLQAGAWIYWAASLQANVEENKDDIAVLQADIDSIEDDIRNILIGVEQLKAHLLVESSHK